MHRAVKISLGLLMVAAAGGIIWLMGRTSPLPVVISVTGFATNQPTTFKMGIVSNLPPFRAIVGVTNSGSNSVIIGCSFLRFQQEGTIGQPQWITGSGNGKLLLGPGEGTVMEVGIPKDQTSKLGLHYLEVNTQGGWRRAISFALARVSQLAGHTPPIAMTPVIQPPPH